MARSLAVEALVLREAPRVYVAIIRGKWLRQHSTPSLRIKDPDEGFNRVVDIGRAREIAVAVLDQKRPFPNAIVLATPETTLGFRAGKIRLPNRTSFFVVDGQHRLASQEYSDFDAPFVCMIHCGLGPREMAELFLEINEKQKRVPASLRWDLSRLIRPKGEFERVAAAELVFALATHRKGPLFQRIDLTGERPELTLKQASIAPALKSLLTGRRPLLRDLSEENQLAVVERYLAAIRACDPDGWDDEDGVFYANRHVQALLRLMPDLVADIGKTVVDVTFDDYFERLKRIEPETVRAEAVREKQGVAGIKALYEQMKEQALPGGL